MTDSDRPDQLSSLATLVQVMHRLRAGCPWDAEQTHESLVTYLLEETHELIEAIEDGTDDDRREELGDLLLQVVFHAEIATERGAFDLERVAAELTDKLIRRHPYVFDDSAVPEDLVGSWEQRKRAEKGRRSALQGIPPMPSVPRAQKVISRSRSHRVDLDLPSEPIGDRELGDQLLALIARAQASGLDADQVLRTAVRGLEQQVVAAEGSGQLADPPRQTPR
ncbi:XTP/dITP diphosphohydrolase [Naumannella halotolerans]|uniref:XTP/dITP diphosphohydrolase n=2 Tax=Naumannella halotolerans TaxID=993414 RepID=A0A4R7J7R2_9ACTN|nr:XTP/dITP diphosphohydrolase [Naumannella halotolerans]